MQAVGRRQQGDVGLGVPAYTPLLDHLYVAALQAVFQNALTHARKMAMIGQYRQGQDLAWDEMPPYAVGFYYHGQLEFWSWNPNAAQVSDAPRTVVETSL